MVAGMSGRHAWYLYFGLYKSTGNHLRYAASFAAANNFQVLSRKLARMDRRAMFMAIYADPYSMAAVCCVNCLKCIIPLLCCMLPWQAARTIFLEDFELSFLAQLFEQLFVIFFVWLLQLTACLSLSASWPCFDLIGSNSDHWTVDTACFCTILDAVTGQSILVCPAKRRRRTESKFTVCCKLKPCVCWVSTSERLFENWTAM